MSYKELLKANTDVNNQYLPELLRLNNVEDKARFIAILESGSIFVHDEIESQVRELMKIRHPKQQLTEQQYVELSTKHFGGTEPVDFGVWVYYPWSKRLVHLLDKDEFIEVRTSRNQYKITLQEREILATKIVGVIGLSVGQSVAVTLAMERSFKEIRLADFDLLELTNLNRIRTGLHNLGISKVISVAREIAEIDPYLKVSVFTDGLTEENMDTFYLGNGKLDVVIDECDGVDMKVLCRVKAKELQIPVLMEASDRCTVDVERFDLEPGRSILHGFIDHLDISKLKTLKTNEEKMPYLAPIVGLNTISTRLKVSGLEIGHTITTWPQLASAVALGGGVVADVWRRIALDQYHESGRYFIDIDELIGNKEKKPTEQIQLNPYEPLVLNDIQKVAIDAIQEKHIGDAQPKQEEIEKIVDMASTAPSGGNAQPWKWVYHKGVLALYFDKYYGFSYMDYKDTASLIAIGAGIENLVIQSHDLGYEVKLHYYPLQDNDTLVALIGFYTKGSDADGLEPHYSDDLVAAIPERHTNRRIVERSMMEPEIYNALKAASTEHSSAVIRFTEDLTHLEDLGKIISETDRFRVIYPQSHHDFTYQEMRWSEDEAIARRTGMGVNTLDLLPGDLLGLRLVKDPKVVEMLRDMDGGEVLRTVSVKNTIVASGMGLLSIPGKDKMSFINGGRASQRLWLKATAMGIAFHPMNVPFAYFMRLMDNANDLPERIKPEVEKLHTRFKEIFSINNDSDAYIYLFRIFRAPAPSRLPYRKFLNDILITS